MTAKFIYNSQKALLKQSFWIKSAILRIFFYLCRQTTNENRAVGTYQANIAYACFLGVPLHRCRLPNQRFGLHRTLTYTRIVRDNPHSLAIRQFSSVLHFFSHPHWKSTLFTIPFLYKPHRKKYNAQYNYGSMEPEYPHDIFLILRLT